MKFLKKVARQIPAVLGLVLLVGAIYVIWKEFRHLKVADIKVALEAIPPRALMIAFGWTVLSYGVLTFYDRLGTIYAGHKVSYGRVSFASFCAYALSHNLGFAAVSGAAVRYRLYSHWGLTPFEIAKVVAFCSLTFGLGGMVLGGVILFWEPDAIPFFGAIVPRWGMYAIGLALWGVVAAYVSLSRFVGTIRLFGNPVTLPDYRMAVVQVALATVDVAVTAAIFYQLLPDTPGLTYIRFLGVYVASYTAGLAANLPGGLGVFDTAMLLGLEPYLQPPTILGAIVVFRLYYYIIPLFLAGSLFAGNEILMRGGALVKKGVQRPGTPQASTPTAAQSLLRWSEPGLAIGASTGAVALCGALLMAVGLLDNRPDFSWIDPDFADIAANAGQFVPSLIGAALIVLSIGLSQRVTLAWGATLVMLLLGAGFTGAQGTNLWIPGVLVLAMLLVAPFRNAYYRHARLLSGPLSLGTALPLLALVLCVVALAAFEPKLRGLSENGWLDIVLSPDLPNSLRLSIAFVVGMALVALWRLIRPSRVRWLPWAGEGRARYAALGALPPAVADGIVMGELGRAGIPFRRVGGVLLGLGDPAGSVNDRASTVWNLHDLAAQEGLDAAVWRAGTGLLDVYADLGMTALPLGPDGLPLPPREADAPPAGQYLCCVAERDLPRLLPLLPDLAEAGLADAAE
jgi:uncharacterized membrane protein YbhN (UPF0104 family)